MKKFLSIFLIFTLMFSAVSTMSFAMENREPQKMQETKVKTNFIKLPVILFSSFGAALIATVSGLIGYKIGNDRRANDEKEITLTGTILGGSSDRCTPIGESSYDIVMLISSCVDEMFQVDIPKVSKEGTFPAQYLDALAFELDVLAGSLDFDDLPYEYRKVGLELHNMFISIKHYVDKRGKKIQLGYLKTLLRDAQKLAIRAGEIHDRIKQEKKKNKAEL